MNAAFIYRPISGEFPEQHFGEINSNCLWVKFADINKEEWVGSFKKSWVEKGTFIIILEKQNKAFVVACGQSFLINVNSREQLNKTEISDTKTAIIDMDEKYIYYSSGFDLRFMDMNGNVFILFDKYNFDDVALLEIRENKLYELYWNFQTRKEPFDFEIDLLTKEVKDSFYDTKKKTN
jgi:hypothetical protein